MSQTVDWMNQMMIGWISQMMTDLKVGWVLQFLRAKHTEMYEMTSESGVNQVVSGWKIV